jgi:BlaI family penicillinase repressor
MLRITAAESQVMEALWRRGAMTSDEIVAEVGASQAWGEATVKTLVNRLLKKKAIESARDGGRHSYRPLLARADYVQAEGQGRLDRLFDGQLAPLVSHFAGHHALKPDDIARLKTVVGRMDDGR